MSDQKNNREIIGKMLDEASADMRAEKQGLVNQLLKARKARFGLSMGIFAIILSIYADLVRPYDPRQAIVVFALAVLTFLIAAWAVDSANGKLLKLARNMLSSGKRK